MRWPFRKTASRQLDVPERLRMEDANRALADAERRLRATRALTPEIERQGAESRRHRELNSLSWLMRQRLQGEQS